MLQIKKETLNKWEYKIHNKCQYCQFCTFVKTSIELYRLVLQAFPVTLYSLDSSIIALHLHYNKRCATSRSFFPIFVTKVAPSIKRWTWHPNFQHRSNDMLPSYTKSLSLKYFSKKKELFFAFWFSQECENLRSILLLSQSKDTEILLINWLSEISLHFQKIVIFFINSREYWNKVSKNLD